MFPTLLWKLQLQPTFRAALDPRILGVLDSMRRDRPAAGEGWQSATTLHEQEALRELVACVDHAARSVLRFLRIGDDALRSRAAGPRCSPGVPLIGFTVIRTTS